MENHIQQRDELVRQITFLNQRDAELSNSCKEKGALLASIIADIDTAKLARKELLASLKETLDEIKDAQKAIIDLIEAIEE